MVAKATSDTGTQCPQRNAVRDLNNQSALNLSWSLKRAMQRDVISFLLSDHETYGLFQGVGHHFSKKLPEDLPPGTSLKLRLLTLRDSQRPSYELLISMTTPTNFTYKEYNTTNQTMIFPANFSPH